MVWNAKVHTFHMVSLFGRTVIAKTMTFYPSTTLATTLQRASFGAVHPGLGNGMSFERERVDSCENAVGTVTESVGSEGACRGVAIGVAWCPLVARGGARGRNAILLHRSSRLSQSCECCICIRHAITDCVWAISIANTSYSFVDKYQSSKGMP